MARGIAMGATASATTSRLTTTMPTMTAMPIRVLACTFVLPPLALQNVRRSAPDGLGLGDDSAPLVVARRELRLRDPALVRVHGFEGLPLAVSLLLETHLRLRPLR